LHPNGSSGTFTDAQVGTIYAILNEVEGAVDWLEGYDEMHFEIDVDANTLAKIAARLPAGGGTPEPAPIDEDDDVYRTFQPSSGPNAGGIWIAIPGYFDVLPSMEYYEILVGQGVAKPVTVLSEREFDVIRDSFARWPRTYPELVEVHRVIDVYQTANAATLSDIQTKVS
jgi:hypothetical protein